MNRITVDYVQPYYQVARRVYLRKNELEFKDSLFDPFGTPTEEQEFFQMGHTDQSVRYHPTGALYTTYFMLDNVINV